MTLKAKSTRALIYAALAMAGGVFFREYTKFLGVRGETTLSLLHVHYFTLGMAFFLLLFVIEAMGRSPRGEAKPLCLYEWGLNITALGLFLRGLSQARGCALSRTVDYGLSGLSGIGHVLLGVGMIWWLWKLRTSCEGAAS